MGSDQLSEIELDRRFDRHWPVLNKDLEKIRRSSKPVFTDDHILGFQPYHGPIRVLVVEDDKAQSDDVAARLLSMGMSVEAAGDGREALTKLSEASFDVILTDLMMPHMDGFALLKELRARGNMTPAIVLTAFGCLEQAISVVHDLGAFWFLEKPIQPGTLRVLVSRAASHAGLLEEKSYLIRQLASRGSLIELVGTSQKMKEIFSLLQQIGPTPASVFISGETGTGKHLVARAIHELSPRSRGPFVFINCAALPEWLLESELFGHEPGAFTGALERRAGCFEQAQGGTLLLHGIDEMPMPTQAKVLQVLEESRVRRLGGTHDIRIDVRVLAATGVPPIEAVRHSRLREDLYYRLSVFRVFLPPLRERVEDLPPLAQALIKDLNPKYGCRIVDLSSGALEVLRRYPWPGNIRELRYILERAIVLAGEGWIELEHLPTFLRGGAPAPSKTMGSADATPSQVGDVHQPPIGTTLGQAEKDLILRTWAFTKNNRRRTAEILGLSLRTLHHKLLLYSRSGAEFKSADHEINLPSILERGTKT
jgi:DNA-binding NtrC family response regulator